MPLGQGTGSSRTSTARAVGTLATLSRCARCQHRPTSRYRSIQQERCQAFSGRGPR